MELLSPKIDTSKVSIKSITKYLGNDIISKSYQRFSINEKVRIKDLYQFASSEGLTFCRHINKNNIIMISLLDKQDNIHLRAIQVSA